MHEPQQPRVSPHAWHSDGSVGALIDIPGHRSRGLFIPHQHLDAVIDALVDIANAETA